jgi:hypothetical protein
MHNKHASVMWMSKRRSNATLPSLWARQRIAGLELDEVRSGRSQAAAIAKLGTEFSLLTRHTSFLAIDEGAPAGRIARTVYVPVDLPAGSRRERVLEDSEIDLDGAPKDDDKKLKEGRRGTRRRDGGHKVTRQEPPPPPAPTPDMEAPDAAGEAEEDDGDKAESRAYGAGSAVAADVQTTSESIALASGGLRLSASLSAGALFAGDERVAAARLAFGARLPVLRRLSLGAELSTTVPFDSAISATFSLAPTVQLALASRVAVAAAFGPSITSDGDFAGLVELMARYQLSQRLGLELRLQRALLEGTDTSSATLGVGFSF